MAKATKTATTLEKPAHKVTLSKAFHMGRHEVTVGQFRRFVEAAGYKTDAEKGSCVAWRASSGARTTSAGSLTLLR